MYRGCVSTFPIIRHLELTFLAEKPPPAHVFEKVARMTAQESGVHK
jgi:hypothetical protein